MVYAKNNESISSVFISAGEQSGDLHASELVKELKKILPEGKSRFSGLGGNLMKNEGVNLLYHINELSAIGYIDVLRKYSHFKNVLKKCLEFVKSNNISAVVLVDYPGFNLRFAEKLREFYKGKIIYYISPQLWAWNEKRVQVIKKYVDKMLVVFPFEVNFYSKYGIDAVYTGHPLVKRIRKFLEENPKDKKVFGERKTLTILPGSRKAEIKNHLPVLLNTATQLRKEFDLTVNISKAESAGDDVFVKYSDDLKDFNLTAGNVYELIINSDIVFTKSGTSTIECALIGTPFLIFYKTYLLNYYLLKPIVKINRLGMVNILSEEMIVKEFIQNEFSRANLLLESRRILTDEHYKKLLKEKLKKIWDILGNEDASLNAAKLISSYITC
jgi:lipid-A-disaccharide synthase